MRNEKLPLLKIQIFQFPTTFKIASFGNFNQDAMFQLLLKFGGRQKKHAYQSWEKNNVQNRVKMNK